MERMLVKPTDDYIFSKRGRRVRNRALLAAMTNKQSHEDGTLSDEEITWLTRRAKDGFGIVTTAASHVLNSEKVVGRWECGVIIT